jgi:hypothetical protein
LALHAEEINGEIEKLRRERSGLGRTPVTVTDSILKALNFISWTRASYDEIGAEDSRGTKFAVLFYAILMSTELFKRPLKSKLSGYEIVQKVTAPQGDQHVRRLTSEWLRACHLAVGSSSIL